MTTEVFIYYRVRGEAAGAALAAVREMHAQLRGEFPHLAARVLRRPDTDKGLQTWMEIYAIEGGVDEPLRARIAALALAWQALVEGDRHTELFTDFDAVDPGSACAS